MRVRSLGQEDPLEEGTAAHSSTLAGKIPWTGVWWLHGQEPGGSTGPQRVGHDTRDLAQSPFTCDLSRLPWQLDKVGSVQFGHSVLSNSL